MQNQYTACPRCGQANPLHSPACARCGQPLQPAQMPGYPAQPGYPPPAYGYPQPQPGYPPGYGYYLYPPPPPAPKPSHPILKRLPVLGSFLVLICFFLPWVNFPLYLLFGFSPQPISENDLQTLFLQAGYPASDLNDFMRITKIAQSGQISGEALQEVNGIASKYISPTHPSYGIYFGDPQTGQIAKVVSAAISIFLIVPLAGLVGLLMLSGWKWTRVLAQIIAFLALGLLVFAVFSLQAMQSPEIPIQLTSLIGSGIWGSIGGLAWQFLAPFFVRR